MGLKCCFAKADHAASIAKIHMKYSFELCQQLENATAKLNQLF